MTKDEVNTVFDLVVYLILQVSAPGISKMTAAAFALSAGLFPADSAKRVEWGGEGPGQWYKLPDRGLDIPGFFGYTDRDGTFHILEVEDVGNLSSNRGGVSGEHRGPETP